MKIAIDISPLSSGHSIRGVGFYLQYLKKSLLDLDKKNIYTFFEKYTELKTDTDIIHFPYFDPFFLTLPLKKRYKTVITIHDLTPLVFPSAFPSGIKGKIKWQIQKRLAQKAEAIITDSQASKKDISRIMNIKIDKIHVVYLAAGDEFRVIEDKNILDDVRKKYNLPDRFALYVGDVTWNKNLVRLVNAVKKTNIPLVMVGKSLVNTEYDPSNIWNSELVAVQKMIKGDQQIITVGFIPTDDLVAIYNLATVFVMPSLYEGFGLPVLEAMQSGTPVITSSNGSLAEIAGEAANIVDATDVVAIAREIENVTGDANLRQQMHMKGLAQAKKFNWQTTARETVVVYEKIK